MCHSLPHIVHVEAMNDLVVAMQNIDHTEFGNCSSMYMFNNTSGN